MIMKKNVFILSLAAGLFMLSGCASKKSLQSCQLENQNLSSQYAKVKDELSETKADLAAAKTRVQLLTDQLAQQKELMAQQKKNQEALQKSLDKSLLNAGSNNVNISKLVDQINESNQYIRHLVNVKSKSVQKGAIELNLEIRLKDASTDFINELADLPGVRNAVLVSYNGDYMS